MDNCYRTEIELDGSLSPFICQLLVGKKGLLIFRVLAYFPFIWCLVTEVDTVLILLIHISMTRGDRTSDYALKIC